MSEEWKQTTLGEIAEIRGGGTPSTKEPTYWGGDIVWLTPTEVVAADGQEIGISARTITREGLEKSSAKLLPKGAVLLTSRASVGFTAIASRELATNQGFQSLVPTEGDLPQFLMLWIQANRDEFTSRASGSTFPEISGKKVAGVPITVPPLAVQRRIVDLMAHLDTHLENLRAERDALRALLAAARLDLLGGLRGTVALQSVLREARAGGTPSRSTPEYYIGSIPWLKSGEVDNPNIEETQEHISHDALAHSSAWLVPAGTPVLAMYGATAAVAGYLARAMATNQAVLALVPDDALADGRLLYHWLRFRAPVLKKAASGAAQPNLSKQVVLRVAGFPDLSIEEQKRIAGVLDDTQGLELATMVEMERLAELRRRVLQQLLPGTVTISKDYDTLLAGVA